MEFAVALLDPSRADMALYRHADMVWAIGWARHALCCTDQQPGAVGPRSDILREANVLRPAKLEHAVQRGGSNGHLGRLPASGP